MHITRVLIVAADPLARAGLALFLEGQDGCRVVGQVGSGADWDEVLAVYQPEVILWDWGWDSHTAVLPALAELAVPVLMLVPTEGLLEQAWQAGARGMLLRQAGAEQITAALVAVGHGLVVLDPAYSPAIPPPTAEAADLLSGREVEVLRLLASGQTNKAIGQVLAISPHTVKFHVSAIMAKLNAQSRTEAVMLATRSGLLPV